MEKQYQDSIFIFRRDLRRFDNPALMTALETSQRVIPIFIFDPRQIKNNSYKSNSSIQFMIESLLDLEKQLAEKNGKLYYYTGHAENVILRILQQKKIDAVFYNYDYTPFSKRRDFAIEDICAKKNVAVHGMHDSLLLNPKSMLKPNGRPYKIFTPFYLASKKIKIPLPVTNRYNNYYTGPLPLSTNKITGIPYLANNPHVDAKGGSRQGRILLKNALKIKSYAKNHDFPAKNSTTHLSPHLKFNTVSIREVYHTLKSSKKAQGILRQLYWRDFFTFVGYYFPHVFGHAYDYDLENIPWENDSGWFSRWCLGETGFPIVDAAMRQLNTTNYMPNRCRLITASFLVKDLLIDWRWGEKYFATKLVDYDPAVNNGNWQWVAGTGCDAQPYMRIFNPWIQQKKFDPDCAYIKQMIPELADVPNKIIHNWDNPKYHHLASGYFPPMVKHETQVKKAKRIYRRV